MYPGIPDVVNANASVDPGTKFLINWRGPKRMTARKREQLGGQVTVEELLPFILQVPEAIENQAEPDQDHLASQVVEAPQVVGAEEVGRHIEPDDDDFSFIRRMFLEDGLLQY